MKFIHALGDTIDLKASYLSKIRYNSMNRMYGDKGGSIMPGEKQGRLNN